MIRPTARGIMLVAAGLVLAVLPAIVDGRLWPFWTVYCAAAILVLGLDAALLPGRRGVTLRVRTAPTLYIGEEAAADVSLRFPASRPVPFELALDASEELVPPARTRGICPPAGVDIRIPLSARRRGRAVIDAVWLRYAGPLRLMEAVSRTRLDTPIAVVPNVMPARRAALQFFSSRLARSGLKIERYKGDGTEFESLRDFVEGDDHRAIHWRSSARHRKLLCREHRAERNHQVVFAVDCGHLMSEPLAGGIPRLDHAVASALLLACVCLKCGDRVGLYGFDARANVFAAPRGGMSQYHRLTQLTAELAYADVETNFTLGITTLSQRLSRRSLVVVLTDFVDTITAELMLENLGRLARRHVVLFVSLRDPDLERLAGTPPDSVANLNRAVVSSASLRERSVVLGRLARLGLLTIDARPSQVGAELINTYLHIKRRELV